MLNNQYIVGLVDGEGSFTVYVKNPRNTAKTKRRVVIEPRFYVKLIAKDKDILYKLKDYFGCGKVYFQGDKRKNHQDCYRYEVYNRNDLINIIIPFFKENKLKFVSKKKDFEIFCELIIRIEKGEHLTKEGLEKLYKIKLSMH